MNTIGPQIPNASHDRSLNNLTPSIRRLSGELRETTETVDKPVAELDNPLLTLQDPKTIEEQRTAHTKKSQEAVAKQNQISQLHQDANFNAKGLLLAYALEADQTLLKKYLERGADSKDAESVERSRQTNLQGAINNPDVVEHVAAQIAQRLEEGKYEDEDGNTVQLSPEQKALYEEVLGVLANNGSHEKLVDLISQKDGKNGFKFPTAVLMRYQSDLEKIAELTESQSIQNSGLQNKATNAGGTTPKLDQREREYFYHTMFEGSKKLDGLGGIFNYDEVKDVTWNLRPYIPNSKVPIRILAHRDSSRTFGDLLTAEQPMPYTNTVA